MRVVLAAAVVLAGLCVPSQAITRPVSLYPVGDSITFGSSGGALVHGQRVEAETPGGYRGTLDSLLTRSGTAHLFVGSRTDNASVLQHLDGQSRHEGWPGFRIDQMRRVIDRQATHVDVALVMLGTNDVVQRYDPGESYPQGRVAYGDPAQRALFVRHLTARLQALVDDLQRRHPGVRVVVATIPPITSTGGVGPPDAVTPDYARAVRALVAGEQRRREPVVLADVWSSLLEAGLVRPGDLAQDGVHPTAAGYARMASVFAAAVRSVLAG